MRLDVFRIRQGRFLTQNRWVLCFTVLALALSCMTANKTYAQEEFRNHKSKVYVEK